MAWTEDDFAKHQARLGKPVKVYPQTVKVVQAAPAGMRPRKYRNTPTLVTFETAEIVNGHLRLCHTFDSLKEADFYRQCDLRRKAGELENLRLQEPFALIVKCQDGSSAIVGEWLADAVYDDLVLKQRITADVKSDGTRTAVYGLKKKIVEACWGISISEM